MWKTINAFFRAKKREGNYNPEWASPSALEFIFVMLYVTETPRLLFGTGIVFCAPAATSFITTVSF
jgi:hypothetical protein